MTKKIAILGASGYTGAELVRLIATHPSLRVAALTGERKAGMAMAEVYPHLRHLDLPKLCTIEEVSNVVSDNPVDLDSLRSLASKTGIKLMLLTDSSLTT